MKFQLVFENTNDSIPFDVVHNEPLMRYFIDKVNSESQNSFSNNKKLSDEVEPKLENLNWAISKSNEVVSILTSSPFAQQSNQEDYLDQQFLNRLHRNWAVSQELTINIDNLRFDSNSDKSRIGSILHECYPDEIRDIKLAPAIEKLGYLYPYEEVNLAVHRLEHSFERENLEFSSVNKWEVFTNPFFENMVSNNDIVNFSFGYTYVGRQYYDKFCNFDDKLEFDDHYNYETLEYSFHLNLSKPQQIPYSKEFLDWAQQQNIKLISNQIPIGNIPDLSENLFKYRKILYKNSRDNNRASIILD